MVAQCHRRMSRIGGLIGQYLVVLGGRAVQGIGAAFFLPASTALLLDVFPPAERGGAQGRMMMISMLITAFSPTVAGAVIQAAGWPFAYLLTILAAVVTLVLLSRVKYTQSQSQHTPFDKVGSVLVFLTVSLFTIGIMQAGGDGLMSPSVLGPVILGAIVGIVLIVLSLRKQHPLIQFRLMKIREVAVALFVTLMRFLPNVLMGAFVARFAQQVLGISPTLTGVLMILPVLAQVVAAPRAGKMLDHAGARRPVLIGLSLLAADALLLAIGFPAQNIWIVLLGTILGGAGFAFTNPVQMAALSVTPLEQRGTLAGIFPLAGNFGTALWVALLTAGLGKLMEQLVTATPGTSEAVAQAGALGSLAWVAAIGTLITLAITFLFLKTKPQPQAQPAKAAVSK